MRRLRLRSPGPRRGRSPPRRLAARVSGSSPPLIFLASVEWHSQHFFTSTGRMRFSKNSRPSLVAAGLRGEGCGDRQRDEEEQGGTMERVVHRRAAMESSCTGATERQVGPMRSSSTLHGAESCVEIRARSSGYGGARRARRSAGRGLGEAERIALAVDAEEEFVVAVAARDDLADPEGVLIARNLTGLMKVCPSPMRMPGPPDAKGQLTSSPVGLVEERKTSRTPPYSRGGRPAARSPSRTMKLKYVTPSLSSAIGFAIVRTVKERVPAGNSSMPG